MTRAVPNNPSGRCQQNDGPISEEILAELQAMRSRLLEMLVPLQSAPDDGSAAPGNGATEEDRLRQVLWSAARELDPLFNETPTDLDLTKHDPTTEQILYSYAVRQYFTPQLLGDPGDVFIPDYSPEQCGLSVFFQYGRWFVTWMKLEEDTSRPEAECRELLVFEKDEQGALLVRAV